MDRQKVIDAIFQMEDTDLQVVSQAVKLRKEQLAYRIGFSLNPGDQIRTTSGLSPKYMCGVTGVVRKVNTKRVVIDFDEPVGRFHRNVTVPLTCVEKVEI